MDLIIDCLELDVEYRPKTYIVNRNAQIVCTVQCLSRTVLYLFFYQHNT